jgi:hypothetical protein
MKRQLIILFTVIAIATSIYAFNGLDFKAELTGAEEVPPVGTGTTAEAKFKVNAAQTEIEFELEIEDGVDVLGIAGAHLHCAPSGVNGPVVVFLAGAVPGGFDEDVEIKGTLTVANIVNTSCGSTIPQLVQSMINGNVYVNVHSNAFPSGVVRGQVRPD